MKPLRLSRNVILDGSRRFLAVGLAMCLAVVAGNVQGAIAQRGSATTASNNANNGTTLTINRPTGVAQGDVMIVTLTKSGPNGTLDPTLSGWTLIQSAGLTGQSSQVGRGAVLYKIAAASEPTSYTFTLNGSGTPVSSVGAIVAFSGVDTNSGPFDVSSPAILVSGSATATSVGATAITTVSANSAVIMVGMGNSPSSAGSWSGWTTTSPGALTQLFGVTTGTAVDDRVTVGGAWAAKPTAGNTGAGSASYSSGCRNGGMLIALKPFVPASAANSSVSASPTSVLADGAATSTITVTLKDASNNPVAGRTVTLSSSRGTSDTISAASGPSSASGIVTFTVTSTTPGSSVFTATDTTDGVTVTQTATVTFTTSTAKDILTFGANYAGSSAVINTTAATVAWTVPIGTAVSSLAPAYTVSPAATGSPVSGTTRDFTTPQTYKITAQDLSTKIYTVTVTVAPPSSAKDVLTFGANYAGSSAVINTNAATVAWTLPIGTSLASLGPAYTVSTYATGSPVSGTTRDFTTPQTYTITAQDGSAKIYTVTATVLTGPQNYGISLATDVAQEFSPYNKSGHPVITGLNNYSNSIPVWTNNSIPMRGLTNAYLTAPWTNNVGSQTMMCSDCHNTDAASPAAQGPHGSAAQFMLRGANTANWPNVTLSNFGTSWCANCHNTFSRDPHGGSHSSYRCYACHIIIPHGGKMSRLIGDRNSMPARYAWQNALTNMQIQSFVKKFTTSYSQGDCQAACTGTHGTAPANGEHW